MVDVQAITQLHRICVERWHRRDIDNPYEGFLRLVCEQHERNYRLWHEEDIARSKDVADKDIAQVKRNIDRLNQQRNDLIERLDDALIAELAMTEVVPVAGARLNTETPGSVIDRLSILALRLYHMQEQADRSDADPQHCEKAKARLVVLREQHSDLSNALTELLADLFSGRKRLKVYRQFKMYNDPTMNPYLYAAKKPAA
ncbi:MAG: DUF4254 domain-containing protein [Pirellulales bacterium]|nr:DUF4254 domain-containing protein [Pirellulales bacterium]